MSAKTPLRAASSSTLTSYSVISPRTSTSICWATSPASAVNTRPSFSVSGMPGRTSSAITPPWTLTASGTSSPDEREPHRPRDRDAGLLLRLVGGGAQVRGGDDVLELEERAVGARLLGEHVEPGGRDPAGLEGVVQRGLVDDAAARGVDQHQRRLGLGQLLGADQADGLRRLGQVHRHEVGLGEAGCRGRRAGRPSGRRGRPARRGRTR